MTEPVTIGIGATKWVKDSNTKMITLVKPDTSTTIHSLHTSAGADYQVPVGKKFIILKINFGASFQGLGGGTTSSTTSFTSLLFSNTTTDSESGAVLLYHQAGGVSKNYAYSSGASQSGITVSTKTNDEVYIELAAGNYIIAKSNVVNSFNITGVETSV